MTINATPIDAANTVSVIPRGAPNHTSVQRHPELQKSAGRERIIIPPACIPVPVRALRANPVPEKYIRPYGGRYNLQNRRGGGTLNRSMIWTTLTTRDLQFTMIIVAQS